MKWEVTLWPNNQSPILVGYYEADTERDAKVQAYYDMDKQGLFCVPDTLDLYAEVATKNTSYQRWINPPPSSETLDIVEKIKRKIKNGKRKNNQRTR